MPNQTERDKRKPTSKLTWKQEKFAQGLSMGKTQADAYRNAYDASNMQEATIYQAAYRLAARDDIRNRVDELSMQRIKIDLHDVELLRAAALETIYSIAVDEKAQTSNRLRAAELLGKVRGVELFGDNIQTNQQVRSATITELEHKIRALLVEPAKPEPQALAIVHVSDYQDKSDVEENADQSQDGGTEGERRGEAPLDL